MIARTSESVFAKRSVSDTQCLFKQCQLSAGAKLLYVRTRQAALKAVARQAPCSPQALQVEP